MGKFAQFPSVHVHQQSLDTASTPEAFAKREKELGGGYLVNTDHGTLQGTFRVIDAAKKEGLKPIIGLEGYVRDDNDPLILAAGHQRDAKGTLSEYAKYFHITLHAQDQVAYEAMVRILSKADARAEKHGSEKKPLFSWADIEELGSYNVTGTSSCLIGIVQRHLLKYGSAGIEMAEKFYDRARQMFKPGNFYVEVFPHVCDRNWDSAGYLVFEDGSPDEKLPIWKKLKFKNKGEGQVQELARKKWLEPDEIVAVMENRKWVEREPKLVKAVEVREGFIMNECSDLAPNGDIQKGCNQFVIQLAKKYGDQIVIADDSHFAAPEQKIVQDIRLQAGGGNWRFATSYHRRSSQEAYEHFRQHLDTTEAEFESWVENGLAWASKFDNFKLKYDISLPTKFYPGDSFQRTMELIDKHGRMDWDDPVRVQRLKDEIVMLRDNGTIDLLPYFFPVEHVMMDHAARRQLSGPGRGSAGGLYLMYVMGITHVDPIKYGLSKDRFLTADRVKSGKLPDVDMDFDNRDWIMDPENGWLKQHFGDHYAQISVDTTLKLRSSAKDVCRVLYGKVPPDVEALTKKFSNAPQGVSDYDHAFGYKGSDGWIEGAINWDPALMEFISKYPEAWEIVTQTLGLVRGKGRHASAVVIANRPIHEFIPMTTVSDLPATQYTAGPVEKAGGLKMDFLVVNAIADIREAINLIQERNGGLIHETMTIDGKKVFGHRIVPFMKHDQDCPVTHKASVDCVTGHECPMGYYDIWDLPEDQAVFRDICEGKTESVFQFNTPGAVGWLKHFNHIKRIGEDGTVYKSLSSIEDLSAFTALDRPGPLDYFVEAKDGSKHNMLVEFAIRARGGERTGSHPALDEMLPETYGIITYQEQLSRIYQILGNTSGAEADEFRVHISKKQMAKVIEDKAVFMRGAVPKLGEEDANRLWAMMETFARYGFNKSHATAYVIITYACAFLKHHFPLEWWTAVLRNANKDEINEKFWPHCGHLIDLPDVNLSSHQFEIRDGRIRAPLSLLHGVGEGAHKQLVKYAPYTDINDFCQKIERHKIEGAVEVDKTVKEKRKVLDADGKDTGEVLVVEVTKKGLKKAHNALNKTVVSTLILSGAMDSVFPPNTEVQDMLQAFNQAMASAQNKKKVEPVDPRFVGITPLVRYQLRKKILAAYNEPLLPMLLETTHPGLAGFIEKRPHFKFSTEGQPIPFMLGFEFDRINNKRPWPEQGVIQGAGFGFVLATRRFIYQGHKEALEIIIDIDGGVMKAVKWPDRRGKLPRDYADAEKTLNGALAVALYTKTKGDKPFAIDDLVVIEPPLDLRPTEEESPSPEEPK